MMYDFRELSRVLRCVAVLLVLVMLPGVVWAQGAALLVGEAKQAVDAKVQDHLGERPGATLQQLQVAARFPAIGNLPVRKLAAQSPWNGFSQSEQIAFGTLQGTNEGIPGISKMIVTLSFYLGQQVGEVNTFTPAPDKTLDEHLEYFTKVLDQAKKRHDAAFEKLQPEHKKFIFDWAAGILRTYAPQLPINDQTRQILTNDRSYVVLMARDVQWKSMVESAAACLSLANPQHLQQVRKLLEDENREADTVPPGVTGKIHYARNTAHGWVIIGSSDDNTYAVKEQVALIIDFAGNDTYQGNFATNLSMDQPLGMVIDVAGNDRYQSQSFSGGSTRGGIGILMDISGDDQYDFENAAGAMAIGGIGILADMQGNDTYNAKRYGLGAGIAGIGLLYDRTGNDEYDAQQYALGFGGCYGVGAVVDIMGDDRYRCGFTVPSGYNPSERPESKPGDDDFQYNGSGMGFGMGRRILQPQKPEDQAFSLAGGVGLMVDANGDDHYESSNFAQGVGYFFGNGIKLDLSGNDEHRGARYAMGSGAHFGLGMFIDYDGEDSYHSTGSTFTAAAAWDFTVSLFIDGGDDDDLYDLTLSEGLGRAQIKSWAAFVDSGGDDAYLAKSYPSFNKDNSVAIFLDRGGVDNYGQIAQDAIDLDNKANSVKDGGLFVDE